MSLLPSAITARPKNACILLKGELKSARNCLDGWVVILDGELTWLTIPFRAIN